METKSPKSKVSKRVVVISQALAIGRLAMKKGVADDAIERNYERLRSMVMVKYPSIDIEKIEDISPGREGVMEIHEELLPTRIGRDWEVYKAAMGMRATAFMKCRDLMPQIGINVEGKSMHDFLARVGSGKPPPSFD